MSVQMVSVIIVNWNTRDLLDTCLASVLRSTGLDGLEVIVVDNFSSDGSAEMVRSKYPSVILKAETTNHGYAKGNNIGFSLAEGDWILTLNSDTEIKPDVLHKTIRAMSALPKVGCAGVTQIGIDGRVQRSVRGFPSVIGILGDITGLGKMFPRSIFDSYRMVGFDYAETGPAPQPMGTYLMFRREALSAINAVRDPFDEDFPIFFNEVDLLKRLAASGWQTYYLSEISILHYGGESTKQVRKNMIWESHKSLVRYLWKHHGRSAMALILPLISAVVYVAALVRAKGYHAGFRP